MDFTHVETNLRDSFRVLTHGRQTGDVRELEGVSIASLGVAFQMFNAAFLSTPVESQRELEDRLRTAQLYFAAQKRSWSFWLCESWLASGLRRRLPQTFETFGLRLASEMPGMVTDIIRPATRPTPPMEFAPVSDSRTMDHFRTIGASCFRVPPVWFAEVFDEARTHFPCWVGYSDGLPVATAAAVRSADTIGIYNVATLPQHRERGYGEAITRYAISQHPASRVILQATSQGLPLYERMGFRAVTRIQVFNSR